MKHDPDLGTPIGRTIDLVVPCSCGAMARRPMTLDEARAHAGTVLASVDNLKFWDSSELHPSFEFEHGRAQG